MESFSSADALIVAARPEDPVLGFRPHAAHRAARWFLDCFPGEVAYAVKANDSPLLLATFAAAGIRQFDVASLAEVELVGAIPGARQHFMNPVKSRLAIRRAYREFGVRCFALDTEDELEKIIAETGGARDLELFVRIAVTAGESRVPLERKFGATDETAVRLLQRARHHADELGITFHVGSQTMSPGAYTDALARVHQLIVRAGVVVDAIDVGGGFPSVYGEPRPAPLATFVSAIAQRFEALPVSRDCRLICEPGRALAAEAESLVVRVEARRGNELFINDGAYGALFDAAHLGFPFPVRLAGRRAEASDQPCAFELWGPTCDSLDRMKGPFMLPNSIREGDYIEFGNIGAYGRAVAGDFNGYGRYIEVILEDEPMLSMYRPAGHPLARKA
ncbi:MAG: type III PLP-dependent enzyme [Rhizobiales bacterium]|nr:type III PLP-dependent enzyme [Hyphomicrobiales bacterium]